MSIAKTYYEHTGKKYFFNIMPLDNIRSVISNGILSHYNASKINHTLVAMESVQDRRDKVIIPNGLHLHKYANLYIDVKNPMMYKRRSEAESLCILVITAAVLDISNAVVSDRNAASPYVRFFSPVEMTRHLDFDTIFMTDWNHTDFYIKRDRATKKCAEILIPRSVPYNYIIGAYVLNDVNETKLERMGFDKEIRIKPSMFFR